MENYPNQRKLVTLRDRIGMLSDTDRAYAFQRITWLRPTEEMVKIIEQAIMDALEIDPRRDQV